MHDCKGVDVFAVLYICMFVCVCVHISVFARAGKDSFKLCLVVALAVIT